MARGAGTASIELGLDVGLAQLHAGRAAVDHAADCGAMRLAEIGDAEEGAEGAAGHGGDRCVAGFYGAAPPRRIPFGLSLSKPRGGPFDTSGRMDRERAGPSTGSGRTGDCAVRTLQPRPPPIP